jgi:hypothetical protein
MSLPQFEVQQPQTLAAPRTRLGRTPREAFSRPVAGGGV